MSGPIPPINSTSSRVSGVGSGSGSGEGGTGSVKYDGLRVLIYGTPWIMLTALILLSLPSDNPKQVSSGEISDVLPEMIPAKISCWSQAAGE